MPAQSYTIPQHAYYQHIFHHVAELSKVAEKAEQKGEDGSKFRDLYKRVAGLSNTQARALDAIALRCERQLKTQDERAFKIIEAFRSRVTKLKSGEPLPPPPPELDVLQQERNDIIVRSITHLRETFGEVEFRRFDEFIKRNTNVTVKNQ